MIYKCLSYLWIQKCGHDSDLSVSVSVHLRRNEVKHDCSATLRLDWVMEILLFQFTFIVGIYLFSQLSDLTFVFNGQLFNI